MEDNPTSKSISDQKVIDRSYHFPTLILVTKASGWLLLSTLFSLLASVKMHSPTFLSNYSWLTYGVLVPAAQNAFIYGFALQAGFAAMLWMTMRLGQVKLRGPGFLFLGTVLWNIALVVGIVRLMGGSQSGYAFLSMPGFVYTMLFTAYALIGGIMLLTFFKRQDREIYPSQWFTYASIYWFPWMLTAASSALFASEPTRGLAQAVVHGWYASGMITIVLGFVGIALLQYLVPKLARRDLHNSNLSAFAFWVLLLFGGFTGLLQAQALPAWVGTLSGICNAFVAFAWIVLTVNLWKTLQGTDTDSSDPFALNLVRLAALCGLLGSLLNFWGSRPGVAETLQFTLYLQGIYWLQLFGFVGTLLLVAVYHFLPRISDRENISSGLFGWKAIMVLYVTGSILVSLVYVLGGRVQGTTLADGTRSFLDVQSATMSFIRISTIGELLVFLAAAVLVINLAISFVSYLVGYVVCCLNCKNESAQ